MKGSRKGLLEHSLAWELYMEGSEEGRIGQREKEGDLQ